jgi:hypothetical protein
MPAGEEHEARIPIPKTESEQTSMSPVDTGPVIESCHEALNSYLDGRKHSRCSVLSFGTLYSLQEQSLSFLPGGQAAAGAHILAFAAGR